MTPPTSSRPASSSSSLHFSPDSLSSPPPPVPPNEAPVPHGALAPLPSSSAISSPASSSSGGSGRGRRMRDHPPPRSGSVQARRSAASLGLGAQYANMNELTSLSPTLSFRESPLPSSYSTSTSSKSQSPSPPAPASRRTSLQFVASPSPSPSLLHATIPPSPGPGGSIGPPPGLGFTTSTPLQTLPEASPAPPLSSASSRAPSRKPSLTHLQSFLSGITHHTRVRSPGVHGGRGVSRSASRSVSRAGSPEGGNGGRRRRRRYGSGGESEQEDGGGGSDGEGSEFSFFGGGGFGGGGSVSRANSTRRARTASANPGGTSLSRASSIRSGRSRASSISSVRSGGSGSTSNSASTSTTGALHPLLHELVRENTTGGAAPSPPAPTPLSIPSASQAGPEVVGGVGAHEGLAAAGTVRPETWERTFEAYKPSTIAAPRHALPSTATQHQPHPEEEPFLDSAPNSPEFASGNETYVPPPSFPQHLTAQPQRQVSSFSSLTRTSSALSSVTNDLSTIDVFDEGERIGVGVWLEGRGGWVRDCFAGGAEGGMGAGWVGSGGGEEGGEAGGDVEGKGPGNGLDGPGVLEVERRLGEGTYAIVYLVREVLYDPDPTDGFDSDDALSPIDPLASFDFDDPAPSSSSPSHPSRPKLHSWASSYYDDHPSSSRRETQYGSYFALKCLCKKNLTDELIEVQRAEAYLHRRLPKHENIVQMYGAYETDDWLFLVLEYAGGRDAFYWLLEAQEHGTEDLYSRAASPEGGYFDRRFSSYSSDGEEGGSRDGADDSALSRTITADTPAHLLSVSVEETPPSPSLLSAAVGDALLSRKRLRLISRMFGQMCSAVQACHDVGISHRDIKPENFIVIDGKGDLSKKGEGEGRERRREGGVVVKITDWGLGTMDEVCEDFDCGSKPYMAYECRNNLRPTYDPRQADVWSLGLVFLNLLYHRNPWADPSLSDPDFSEYVDDPIGFLQTRFEGMSDDVAHFLSERVFCDVLEVVDGRQRRRVSAGEFGQWASRLVNMMSPSPFSPGPSSGAPGAPYGNFSLHGASGNALPPHLRHSDSTFSSAGDLDFSPVASMPLFIPGGGGGYQVSPTPGAANLPPTPSLLTQFAPSTLRASTTFPPPGLEQPHHHSDASSPLPTVPEIPDAPVYPRASRGGGGIERPTYITSPSALSEDGESLPSPTFPSPPPPPSSIVPSTSAAASPERTFVRMPWSSPSLVASALPPSSSTTPAYTLSPADNPFAISSPSSPASPASPASPPAAPPSLALPTVLSPLSSPSAAPAAPSGISLLAARRPSLLESAAGQGESMLSTTSQTTVMPGGGGGGSGPASLASSPSPHGGVNGLLGGRPSPPPLAVEDEEKGDEEKEEGEEEKGGAGDGGKEGEEKKKTKRRKRGARKEKRAAREQAREAKAKEKELASPPPGGRVTLANLAEGEHPSKPRRDNVLDDLAAASQELARELSAAKTNGGTTTKPTRPRPVPSSRSHGTQSSSAVPFSFSSASNHSVASSSYGTSSFPSSSSTAAAAAPSPSSKKQGGMFGRLKTLVNEGNSDLEAFKRRVDERNASIGATSAPAKMQGQGGVGVKVPKGKFDSPFSSRGSVGTASWGSAAEGGDEGRGREGGVGVGGAGGAGGVGKDHWSSASSRRDRLHGKRVEKGAGGGGGGRESDFAPSSSSTRATLPPFSEAASRTATPLSSFGSVGSGGDWRSGSHSRTRGVEAGLAPPLPVSPSSPPVAKSTKPVRPKLKDAATDTSDLNVPTTSSTAALASSRPTLSPRPSVVASSSTTTAKSSPRPLANSLPSASPVLSPAAVTASAPAGSPAGTPAGGKSGNKLAKMLNSISVFNSRGGGGAGTGSGGAGGGGSGQGSPVPSPAA
ncbi:hypothetical protein JCM8547_005326 [Rhodosporidiobolus lusitaniae]